MSSKLRIRIKLKDIGKAKPMSVAHEVCESNSANRGTAKTASSGACTQIRTEILRKTPNNVDSVHDNVREQAKRIIILKLPSDNTLHPDSFPILTPPRRIRVLMEEMRAYDQMAQKNGQVEAIMGKPLSSGKSAKSNIKMLKPDEQHQPTTAPISSSSAIPTTNTTGDITPVAQPIAQKRKRKARYSSGLSEASDHDDTEGLKDPEISNTDLKSTPAHVTRSHNRKSDDQQMPLQNTTPDVPRPPLEKRDSNSLPAKGSSSSSVPQRQPRQGSSSKKAAKINHPQQPASSNQSKPAPKQTIPKVTFAKIAFPPYCDDDLVLLSSLLFYHTHVPLQHLLINRFVATSAGTIQFIVRLACQKFQLNADVGTTPQYRLYLMNTTNPQNNWLYTCSSLKKCKIWANNVEWQLDSMSNREAYCDYLDISSVVTLAFDNMNQKKCRELALKIELHSDIGRSGVMALSAAKRADPTSIVMQAYRTTLTKLNVSYNDRMSLDELKLALNTYLNDRDLLRKRVFIPIPDNDSGDSDEIPELLLAPVPVKTPDEDDDDDDVLISEEKFSLRCPYSLKRLVHPGKSLRCSHNDCFDIALLLNLAPYESYQECPMCKKNFHINELYIDPQTIQLLQRAPKAGSATVKLDGTIVADNLADDEDGDSGSDGDGENRTFEDGTIVLGDSDVEEDFDPSRVRPVDIIIID